jgi:hypothetical protein
MPIKQTRLDAAQKGSPAEQRAGDSSGQKTPRWELILRENGSQGWSWRRIGIDGSVETASGSYPNFGLAIGDAVKNGFRAKDQEWTIRTQKSTTHFPPGKTPFSIRAESDDPRSSDG